MMIIGVDFDGTVVKHDYPRIGEPVPYALHYLKEFNRLDTQLILWTVRSGENLDAARVYLEDSGIKLYGVNDNPAQDMFSESPKAYCNLYIDDAAFGCPLIREPGSRPYVDWRMVGPIVKHTIINGVW